MFIVHGWAGSPKEPMHQWLKKELEKEGFQIHVLKMPNPKAPTIHSWIETMKQEVGLALTKDMYFIGHSIGCQTVLRFLEIAKGKSGAVCLIAPWLKLKSLDADEERAIAKEWEETSIEWNNVKNKSSNFLCQFSDDDPYVFVEEAKKFKKFLNADIVIEKKKGHFTETDNYEANTTVINYLLNI